MSNQCTQFNKSATQLYCTYSTFITRPKCENHCDGEHLIGRSWLVGDHYEAVLYRVCQKSEATTFVSPHYLLTSSKRVNRFLWFLYIL